MNQNGGQTPNQWEVQSGKDKLMSFLRVRDLQRFGWSPWEVVPHQGGFSLLEWQLLVKTTVPVMVTFLCSGPPFDHCISTRGDWMPNSPGEIHLVWRFPSAEGHLSSSSEGCLFHGRSWLWFWDIIPLGYNQQIPSCLWVEQAASWEFCDLLHILSLMIQHHRKANIHLTPSNEETWGWLGKESVNHD